MADEMSTAAARDAEASELQCLKLELAQLEEGNEEQRERRP